ncbi:MAG: VWA domain-containing protein [Pirellulales bacterium]|nr:VWA domain-containing protein [Pirellulales bacterium]
MLTHTLAFDSPGYLLLLALIPALWWWGYRSLAGLGRWRRLTALSLRSLVLAAIVLALADVQYQRKNEQLSVVYLLDQSLSIPGELRQQMMEYVKDSIQTNRKAERGDRYAVIVFGRDAEIEIPLVESELALHSRVESLLDPEYTDLGTAIQRAKAIFPHDAARRIVLVTDGNQNLGNAYREARAAADAGVSLDVVPVHLKPRTEVSVEKVDLPAGVRRGQPFELRVVLNNEAPTDSKASARGTLRIIRKTGDNQQTVAEQEVTLPPGKRVFTIPEEIDQADFYTYEARFSPATPEADGTAQNNTASAFTHIRGRGQVLVIENFDAPGEFDELVDRLRTEGLETTVRTTGELFNSLAELQRYDCIVLGNVPRSSGDDAENVANFSDAQIDLLVRNTSELGCGLVMLGGPETFGAGGWANTKLEEAMPVDFQIKSAKVAAVGALALVIDRSGSMSGPKLSMSRAAAIAAVKSLGSRDYVSVTAFDQAPYKIVPLQRVGDYRRVASRIERITEGGGTDLFPAMEEAFRQLKRAEASVKHMIVLTDGQTPDAEFARLVRQMSDAKITVTGVAVGTDANVDLLRKISTAGGGKFYFVREPRALPRIFMSEVRRVARPLVYEPAAPVTPHILQSHEILTGLEAGVPPIRGFVLTDVKKNPLVQVLLQSPLPATPDNATVLAVWNYGAGKTAALTTDAGARWADAWKEWDGYDKFFSQLVRWAMRPVDGAEGDYTVATNVRDGRTEIVVTALDAAGEFVNGLPINVAVVPPRTPGGGASAATLAVSLEQTAPGRYVGSFASETPGAYMLVTSPAPGAAPIVTGVNVAYSPEYRSIETNIPLLRSLAELPAGAGPAGEFAEAGLQSLLTDAEESRRFNPFRDDLPWAVSAQSIWPWVVVVGSVLFWSDVFVRRVQLDGAWIGAKLAAAWGAVIGRKGQPAVPETMARLRHRKEQIARQYRGGRDASLALPDPPLADAARGPSPVAAATAARPEPPSPPAPDATASPTAGDAEEDSYTQRLLRAKKKVWE